MSTRDWLLMVRVSFEILFVRGFHVGLGGG